MLQLNLFELQEIPQEIPQIPKDMFQYWKFATNILQQLHNSLLRSRTVAAYRDLQR